VIEQHEAVDIGVRGAFAARATGRRLGTEDLLLGEQHEPVGYAEAGRELAGAEHELSTATKALKSFKAEVD
jgi:hypothetical protein